MLLSEDKNNYSSYDFKGYFIYLSVFLVFRFPLLLFPFVELSSAGMLLSSSSELDRGNIHAWLVTDKWDKVSFYLILPCSRIFIFFAVSISHRLSFDLNINSYLCKIYCIFLSVDA